MVKGAAGAPASPPSECRTRQQDGSHRLGPGDTREHIPCARGVGDKLIALPPNGAQIVARARLQVMADRSNRGWDEVAVGLSAKPQKTVAIMGPSTHEPLLPSDQRWSPRFASASWGKRWMVSIGVCPRSLAALVEAPFGSKVHPPQARRPSPDGYSALKIGADHPGEPSLTPAHARRVASHAQRTCGVTRRVLDRYRNLISPPPPFSVLRHGMSRVLLNGFDSWRHRGIWLTAGPESNATSQIAKTVSLYSDAWRMLSQLCSGRPEKGGFGALAHRRMAPFTPLVVPSS